MRSAEFPVYGAIRAIDPTTGQRKWEFKFLNPSTTGLLTTASGLLFGGDAEGNLLALDSRNGKLLWRYQMGSPLTHVADDLQVDFGNHSSARAQRYRWACRSKASNSLRSAVLPRSIRNCGRPQGPPA